MMTVSKEILLHPDFTTDIALELCEMLEALIDAEFEKGDETDFDFIDECAQAINAIRSGNTAQILPIISRKDFFGKLGIKTKRKFGIAVAVCAALVIVFTAGTQIKTEENISLIQAFSGIVSEFFKGEKPIEATTAQPAMTTETAANLINIIVEASDDFKTEYYVGEEFSDKGMRVFAEYHDGTKELLDSDDYTLLIPESFGTEPKYETVTVTVGKFKQTVEVRVIESLTTVKLNSIYAVFPEDFDFTADDLYNIGLGSMQVFAVYSDGSEKELNNTEYSVEYEHKEKLFEKSVQITVIHEECSCSFVIYEKREVL